jgi:uncharacterized membrane protein
MKKNQVFVPVLFSLIVIVAFTLAVFFQGESWFHLISFGVVSVFLEFTILFLYLLSAVLILLGSILLTVRYVRIKLQDPLQPSEFELRARFLTVGLEILIGAEIIGTAVTRTLEGFLVLVLTIAIRGFIALILHMEERWISK